MKQNSLLFWQPKIDFLKILSSNFFGQTSLVVFNYLIWFFLFYVSFTLIKSNINIFWQLFFSTLFAEIIEKIIKSKIFWKRPMFTRHDVTPPGLVDKWYQTGSFPSGHTIKAAYFFLFCLQYQAFSPTVFLCVVIPLILFRVFVGFHYPVDVIGGIVIGVGLWFANNWYVFPEIINQVLKLVFSTLFMLPYAG